MHPEKINDPSVIGLPPKVAKNICQLVIEEEMQLEIK
jgi:hypothetical protein